LPESENQEASLKCVQLRGIPDIISVNTRENPRHEQESEKEGTVRLNVFWNTDVTCHNYEFFCMFFCPGTGRSMKEHIACQGSCSQHTLLTWSLGNFQVDRVILEDHMLIVLGV
jgi:hypothetical protein